MTLKTLTASEIMCLCGGKSFQPVFFYDGPPEGETRFPLISGSSYSREIRRCESCGHFLSVHSMDMDVLYQRDYADFTYATQGIKSAFERIINLDPSQSDNSGRVQRILEFSEKFFSPPEKKNRHSVLDIGSGLCVFLYRMKAAGWQCTALDPDPRAVEHAKKVVGVEAIQGDSLSLGQIGLFNLITFNKVLEHVEDPVTFLEKSKGHLLPGGFVYAEVPDGEAAVTHGPSREEFFIEHHHIFSAVSLAILMKRAGFGMKVIERLREPSGKFTLWTIAVPRCN